MISDKYCIDKWGEPKVNSVKWEIATGLINWYPDIHLNNDELFDYRDSCLPNKIYMNKMMSEPFTNVIKALSKDDLLHTIRSWDGCYQIRRMKAVKDGKQVFSDNWSLHSWGIAIDIDAAWNKQGGKSTMNKKIVDIFKNNGFDWGGDFKTTKDPMHFQLSKI